MQLTNYEKRSNAYLIRLCVSVFTTIFIYLKKASKENINHHSDRGRNDGDRKRWNTVNNGCGLGSAMVVANVCYGW